nr:hypothetical protein Hi04_10k_c2220_00020 [uncultured bacterium]
MITCPKFETCSAPVCPIDPDWPSTNHLSGEKVCPYLMRTGKPGEAELLAADPVGRTALALVEEIGTVFPAIGRAVKRASQTGAKGAHLRSQKAPLAGAV